MNNFMTVSNIFISAACGLIPSLVVKGKTDLAIYILCGALFLSHIRSIIIASKK